MMDGLREAIFTLRLLTQCNRLTAYERAAVKYALVLLSEYQEE